LGTGSVNRKPVSLPATTLSTIWDFPGRRSSSGSASLLARVDTPVLAAQPFAVDEVGAAELAADGGATEPIDRLAVGALGGWTVAQQRT
jgi:hypothetical protein